MKSKQLSHYIKDLLDAKSHKDREQVIARFRRAILDPRSALLNDESGLLQAATPSIVNPFASGQLNPMQEALKRYADTIKGHNSRSYTDFSESSS